MRVVKLLFICHLTALVCGLGVLLIIAPHPTLWNSNPVGVTIFEFVLRSAGISKSFSARQPCSSLDCLG